ncbi:MULTISPECIES: cyclopropane-fatty-acyl-phospholipid synthase family protein [unclassified Leclercia]|uniref:SAM-dependent methyltransferase n=1 Tax=unclassified Leclercia TaxID=2627398 RepID=UPI000DF2E10D|nr:MULTISPECIES: class I SAM-dependent methyltransferase [unclassified Leclercia]AXF62699.1 class I SAM-dependent methyltransferase [Leclercia sp. W17]
MHWQPFRGAAPSTMTIHSASFPDVSDNWPMKDEVTRELNAVDRALKADPQLMPPIVEKDASGEKSLRCQHPWSEKAFTNRPAVVAWRTRLVPTALALYAIQNPLDEHLPDGTRMDSNSRQWFIHANDAIGIRSRAKVMAVLAEQYLRNDIDNVWVSLASGASVPVLEALRGANLDGQKVHLTLVDVDPVSLKWAEKMTAAEGLRVGEQVTILQRDLKACLIHSDKLVQELGEGRVELVDALGIFEYFNDAEAATFLQHILRLVKPGGAIIVSNMLTSSPQIDFALRCIGWTPIFPRTLQQLQDIHLAAGIPAENVTVIVPKDGVYAVMEIRK